MGIESAEGSQIVLPLPHTPFIARLIFFADQTIGTTDSAGYKIQITSVVPDGSFNMSTELLGRFESVFLTTGIGQETAEFRAICALTNNRVRPREIGRRCQWFCDTATQMGHAGCTQAPY